MTARKNKAGDQSINGAARDAKKSRTDIAAEPSTTASSSTPNNSDNDRPLSVAPSTSAVAAREEPAPGPSTTMALAQATPVVSSVRAVGEPITEDDLTLRPVDQDYITDEFTPRLVSIINYVEPDANRFNIGLIPAEARWGPVGDGSGLDKFLCVGDRPVTAWMVGVVTSTWFAPTEGSRVSVGVRLLCQRDLDAARFFQYRACRPHGDATHAGLTTYAGRYLGVRGEDGPVVFDDAYDGRDRLAGWGTMTKIDATRIQKTDVVVVECYIKRFRPREGGNRFTWAAWGVSFELLRVAQLISGPGPADLLPEDSQVNL